MTPAAEEPGGLGAGPAAEDHRAGCITCGDEALEMVILQIDRERDLALCAGDRGIRATVEIALVHPVAEGDRLLVHAGTAIARAGEPSA